MIAPHFLSDDDSDLRLAPGFGPESKTPAASGGASTVKAERRIRVLLVEDSVVDARLVQLTLKHNVGTVFEVVTEATVTKAVERLAEGGFQIVLLDLELPDSSGLDTFRRIHDRAAGVPIIVLTGNEDEEIGIQAIHQGAQEYLVKGRDSATLTRTIRYAMSRHRLRRKLEKAAEFATASESKLRMIIEKNLDGIVVVNQAGLVVHANAAAEALFAYPAGTFVGQRFPLTLAAGSSREMDVFTCQSRIVPTEVRCNPIEWDGQPASLVLLRDLTERRRMETTRHELKLAREVQQMLLPTAVPSVSGFEIAGATISADDTGGDYFDYLKMPNGILGLTVADASGHGIAAAMQVTSIAAYLRAFGSQTTDPGEVLRRVAQTLGPHLQEGHFVTAVLACIDPTRRTVTYASAGHPSALIIDEAGNIRSDLFSLDLPIGLDPDCAFQSSPEVSLHPGDTLVLISDGILEAMSVGDLMFGKPRVIELIRQHRNQSAQTIVDTLIQSVRDHCDPKSPADDLTVLVAKIS